MEIILLAVPPAVTAIMFGVKRLAGLALFENGASAHPFLRLMLILFSLLGILSTSLLTGNEIDADSVSTLVVLALGTGGSAFGSHWLYKAVRNIMGR